MDENQQIAVSEYLIQTGRVFEPGEIVEIPLDALIFAQYQGQYIYPTLEDFKERRCKYDPETNEWLVNNVTEVLLRPEIPPIYVDITKNGVALVDGAHRVSARLIAGHQHILAHLNKQEQQAWDQ
jgi:hypothetical protein